jgi:hypothetical protein
MTLGILSGKRISGSALNSAPPPPPRNTQISRDKGSSGLWTREPTIHKEKYGENAI